ncbi:MAG: ABC transporter ATP-binding protein [Proteobacteria bacterium]|nr:ABC transporter ATP-binding protein [Pseudomonadota bacterium]
MGKWRRGPLPTNQQTVRLALRNIITKWHARLGLPGHLSPRHERLSAGGVRPRRRRPAVALRLVGAVKAALKLVDLTVSYDRHPAVHHVSVEIPAAEMTALVGPNGSGKSTLLKAILGLVRRVEGRIECSARRIAYLPQQAEIARSFPISVLDTVLLGRWSRFGAFGRADRSDVHDAHHAIQSVGLGGFERRPIDTLSVGQFQRVLFARLLLQDADLVLLDEPFAAIDTRTVTDLMDVIRRWRSEQRTVIAVLHDLDQVRRDFPNSLLLARELVAAGPTGAVLSPENLLRARAMAEAWDERADACEVRRPEAVVPSEAQRSRGTSSSRAA